MAAYFSRDKIDSVIDVTLVLAEQGDAGPFNKGCVRNAAVREMGTGFDYYCFHDVDYLPVWADYSFVPQPVQLVWYGADAVSSGKHGEHLIRHRHEKLFGGAVLVPAEQFRAVNGFSNRYPGWGYEDRDLSERLRIGGYEILRRDGTYRTLSHTNMGRTAAGTPSPEAEQNKVTYLSAIEAMAHGDHLTHGLSTVSARLLRRSQAEIRYKERTAHGGIGRRAMTHLVFDLSGPPDVSSRAEYRSS
jgi:hypothetical protein